MKSIAMRWVRHTRMPTSHESRELCSVRSGRSRSGRSRSISLGSVSVGSGSVGLGRSRSVSVGPVSVDLGLVGLGRACLGGHLDRSVGQPTIQDRSQFSHLNE